MTHRAVRNSKPVVLSVVIALTALASAQTPDIINEGGQSLVARATPVTWITGRQTGFAWQSVIQAPNYQTDRDVGASSVGMGLLAAYDMTGNSTYLQYAEGAGDFLVAAQVPAGSGRWPDFYNPSGPNTFGFTSFDDGAAGIGDFLWRLYERTNNTIYKNTAIAAMDWLVSKAHAPTGQSCPSTQCFWYWFDPPTSAIYTGMGQGQAGIGWTFDEFSKRLSTSDPARSQRYEQYALAIAAYLQSNMVLVTLPDHSTGAEMPEQTPNSGVFDTGFLNGSAGDAFFFYKIYRSTGNSQYLTTANELFAWVRAQAVPDRSPCAGVKWPIQTTGTGSRLNATGVEEGNAGIGWVAIQANKILQPINPALAATDLQIAQKAGDWLLSSCVAFPEGGGTYWPEDEGKSLVHTSLDNGAPGIGVFLYDLYQATGNSTYMTGATNARNWINHVTFSDNNGAYWCENRKRGSWNLCREPSWHWGTAGIINMAARMAGWSLDIPGEEPAF